MSKLVKKITPLLLILSLNTLAADNSVLTYISTGSGTEITGCVNSCPTNIEIPSTINETTVTSIGQSAFEGATALTAVTLPDSVTNIGERAFYNTGLTSLNIPDSVTQIGELAFAKNPIQTLQIGSGLEQQNNVGAGAFYGLCPTLESVSINSPHALGRGSRITKQLPWYQYNFHYGSPSLRGDYIYSGLHFTQGPLRLEGYLGNYSNPAYQYHATNQDSASVEQCANLTSISFGDEVISIG